MTIEFNLQEDLRATEIAIVDWKRRARAYEQKGFQVPARVAARIEMLKQDALLLRRQIEGKTA